MADQKLTLNNGVKIPIIGFGAWAPADEDQNKVKGWLSTALKAGYRHIDTAQGYGTEKAVGEAVRESGIPREEIFVTTKLPWNHHGRVAESFAKSLENLDIGYIDLYLMHWPQALFYDETNDAPTNPDGTYRTTDTVTFNESWAEIEKLVDTGKVRAIGVSNFSIKNLEKLFETAKIVPAVNQVELHPYLAQDDLISYCTKKGIIMTGYSPSGWAEVRNDATIVEIAKKYNATPTQVILAWHVARKTVIVPKSVNPERQKENLQLPDLAKEDVDRVSKLDRHQRICNKGDEHGQVWGWTLEQLGW